MLSQTVEYALRAMVHLAAAGSSTTDQVAVATRVPKAYLSKVLQSLVRAGLVNSQRGVRGGMSLSRPAAEITILQVVNAVEPLQRIHTCPLGLSSHGKKLCPLHKRMDDALLEMERAFSSTCLSEVLAVPGESVPLCDEPPPPGASEAPPAPDRAAATPGTSA